MLQGTGSLMLPVPWSRGTPEPPVSQFPYAAPGLWMPTVLPFPDAHYFPVPRCCISRCSWFPGAHSFPSPQCPVFLLSGYLFPHVPSVAALQCPRLTLSRCPRFSRAHHSPVPRFPRLPGALVSRFPDPVVSRQFLGSPGSPMPTVFLFPGFPFLGCCVSRFSTSHGFPAPPLPFFPFPQCCGWLSSTHGFLVPTAP